MPTPEQQKLIEQFEDRTGFEFAGKNALLGNCPRDFVEKWRRNVERIRNMADEVDGLITHYYNTYHDDIEG